MKNDYKDIKYFKMASNDSTPDDVLYQLALMGCDYIKRLVALNKNCDIAIFRRLIKESNFVKEGIAYNLNTPISILKELEVCECNEVKLALDLNTKYTNYKKQNEGKY